MQSLQAADVARDLAVIDCLVSNNSAFGVQPTVLCYLTNVVDKLRIWRAHRRLLGGVTVPRNCMLPFNLPFNGVVAAFDSDNMSWSLGTNRKRLAGFHMQKVARSTVVHDI